jgi:transposase
MEVLYPKCCGLDVHNEVVVACVRIDEGAGHVSKQTRQFGTTMSALRELGDWLSEQGCTVVGMESTGVYWKPVYHVLCTRLPQIVVGNPRDMHRRRGKKTDKLDADWISELLAHDLISNSFVPPPHIVALRDLTRTRTTLVETRAQGKNRVHRVLQDTNIKLANVATDMFGKSGRAMLDALVQGERDPNTLSELALGRLRVKIPQLELALEGQFTEHHGALIRMSLCQIDLLDEQIAEIDERIAKLVEATPRVQAAIEQLDSIPGVDQTAARIVVSEIGTDMDRFEADKRLASWAGLCPGNNVSAGKHKGGRTRKGNRHVRRVLNQSAWAARKTDTFLGRRFRSLQARIGGKKAAMAVAHQTLIIAYHLLKDGTFYEDELHRRRNPQTEERWRRNAVQTLERLGYTVTLQMAPAPASAA